MRCWELLFFFGGGGVLFLRHTNTTWLIDWWIHVPDLFDSIAVWKQFVSIAVWKLSSYTCQNIVVWGFDCFSLYMLWNISCSCETSQVRWISLVAASVIKLTVNTFDAGGDKTCFCVYICSFVNVVLNCLIVLFCVEFERPKRHICISWFIFNEQ